MPAGRLRRRAWRASRNSNMTGLARALRPAGLGLLPIDELVAGVLGRAPALARRHHGALVIAVEHVADAAKIVATVTAHAIDQDEQCRRVGILVQGGEQHGLA